MNDTDCLNMGYILKDYQDQYYFGNKNEQYEILNTHSKTEKTENLTKNVISVPISIKKGEKTELSLLWKWVSQNDKVDTWIGNRASSVDTDYKLTVSIQYKATKTACENGG